MTEFFLQSVPVYGVWLILLTTFLSCLALPVPSSLIMLVGGAFIASGDLSAATVVGGAWAGAVAGDQTGFFIGRIGGRHVTEKLGGAEKRKQLLAKADDYLLRWGGLAVFLTRWLLSPFGPYVNFIGGGANFSWPVFSISSALGEATWVSIYVTLGYAFASQISQVSDITGSAIGLIAALAATVVLGMWLHRSMK